jgi:hypothetical protein
MMIEETNKIESIINWKYLDERKAGPRLVKIQPSHRERGKGEKNAKTDTQ